MSLPTAFGQQGELAAAIRQCRSDARAGRCANPASDRKRDHLSEVARRGVHREVVVERLQTSRLQIEGIDILISSGLTVEMRHGMFNFLKHIGCSVAPCLVKGGQPRKPLVLTPKVFIQNLHSASF